MAPGADTPFDRLVGHLPRCLESRDPGRSSGTDATNMIQRGRSTYGPTSSATQLAILRVPLGSASEIINEMTGPEKTDRRVQERPKEESEERLVILGALCLRLMPALRRINPSRAAATRSVGSVTH